MTIQEFQKHFNLIVPPAVAWKGDNVGLQVGRADKRITNIILALDVTFDVAEEAVRKKANLIITHHPLLFHPLKNISLSTRVGKIVGHLLNNNINLFAAHTNLDSVRGGVNFSLAAKLGLKNVSILSPIKESLVKIAVFVPELYADAVADTMHASGAGMFSRYDHCSFRSNGRGTFRGMNDAQPFIGKIGQVEKVNEIKLEMLCETWKLQSVLGAMRSVHPYEEIAYDIIPLNNQNSEYGIGAVGELPNAVSEQVFLDLVKKKLKVPSVRYAGKKKKIRRVAVCGGSGTEYINDAIEAEADAMVTADVKYHTFQDAQEQILLVDAGHYETENIVLPSLAKMVGAVLNKEKNNIKIFITEQQTNPLRYY